MSLRGFSQSEYTKLDHLRINCKLRYTGSILTGLIVLADTPDILLV